MNEHTKEPWKQTSFAIYDEAGRMILQIGISADRCFRTAEMEANARRIVACVNACAGLPTEMLEESGIPSIAKHMKLEQQRDELLAALENSDHNPKCAVRDRDAFDDREPCDCGRDAAIAKVKS